MPIYEFKCPECETSLETLARMGEVPELECPECAYLGPMSRLLSAPSPHQVNGRDGRVRAKQKRKARNEAFDRSSRGKEFHAANLENCRRRGLPV
jgi:putative FmdB family regulatory protein